MSDPEPLTEKEALFIVGILYKLGPAVKNEPDSAAVYESVMSKLCTGGVLEVILRSEI